jgi:hypothetical protein
MAHLDQADLQGSRSVSGGRMDLLDPSGSSGLTGAVFWIKVEQDLWWNRYFWIKAVCQVLMGQVDHLA